MPERAKGQCLCEVYNHDKAVWVPCMAGVVPDSPFCVGCENRHVEVEVPVNVRVRKIKVRQ